MLMDTKFLINELNAYLQSNPEPNYDNEYLKLIIHSENKLIKKFIRYLENLG
jgi:hypothetical protein